MNNYRSNKMIKGYWLTNLIVMIMMIPLGFYVYKKINPAPVNHVTPTTPANQTSTTGKVYKCDGRTHCSHMTSCEEATFFLRNCPNTKMDGNNDGIPCEKQWCKH